MHRDIEPRHVIVTESGVAKLLDLGIAKALGAHLTRDGESPALLIVARLAGAALLWRPAAGPDTAAATQPADPGSPTVLTRGPTAEELLQRSGPGVLRRRMTKELIKTLTKVEALRVIAHRAVLRFKRSNQPLSDIARTRDVQ